MILDKKKNFIDLTGKTYHYLTVCTRLPNKISGKQSYAYWWCRCKCGNWVSVRGNSLRHNNTYSCGCYNREILDKRKNLQPRKRSYYEYEAFHKFVLMKDKYECRICGKHGGNLIVHHLESFTRFKDIATDPNNGIVLCTPCHKYFHRKYGQLSFSEGDFYLFYLEFRGKIYWKCKDSQYGTGIK